MPRDSFITGIIIDDLVYMEKVLRDLNGNSSMSADACTRIAAMDRQYKFVGLQTHPKKSFRDSTEATFWGAHVDGRAGLIRANPQRVIPMLAVVCRVIRIGYASISLLETVAVFFSAQAFQFAY